MTYTPQDAAKFAGWGDTANGIPFDWWLANADGAGFCLVPTIGIHTEGQVETAKARLKRDRDVVGRILVHWLKSPTILEREIAEAWQKKIRNYAQKYGIPMAVAETELRAKGHTPHKK